MQRDYEQDRNYLRKDHFTLQKEHQKLKFKKASREKMFLELLNRARRGEVEANNEIEASGTLDSDNGFSSAKPSASNSKTCNIRFFKKLTRWSFPDQAVLVDSPKGEIMLRKALKNYPTVSAWTAARNLSGNPNKNEAATLAKIIDCMISSLVVIRAKDEPAIELAIRPLAALVMANRTET